MDRFVVDDRTDRVQDAARRSHQEGRDFLPVHPTPRGVRVGPYVTAGQPGCHHCVRVRERRARVTGTPQRSAHWRALYEGSVTAPTPVLGPPVRATVAVLVADELARVARGATARCAGAVLEVGTATLAVSRHRFIAEPECPSCATLPDDGPEAGTLTLVSRPKSAPDNYRARSLPAEHERLLETMVDVETGLISSMTLHHNHPMILAAAIGGPACCTELSGYGRTFSFPASVSVALAEALERLGGTLPRARRTRVRASFRELGPDRAVAPPALGLPDSPPHHNAARYHPDLPLMLVDEDDRAGEPKAFCGAGAHLDPERALWSGLVELASVADATKEMVAADTTAPGLVVDSDLVRSMEDHALVAAAPPRLRELPVRLGYRSTPLPPEEINPYPHPFP
ncbi:TOMM precursor leader peptide-binding protein [Micromonospora sp. NPDC049900]|uniref:TOMM precursor leader peptide-binding protein n=1 Tax=Micromonospora sp. NPDC049900 TaxID=3364275 RepID=UPI0037B69BE0